MGPVVMAVPGRWYIKLQIGARYLEDVLALVSGRRRILVDVKWSPGGRSLPLPCPGSDRAPSTHGRRCDVLWPELVGA